MEIALHCDIPHLKREDEQKRARHIIICLRDLSSFCALSVEPTRRAIFGQGVLDKPPYVWRPRIGIVKISDSGNQAFLKPGHVEEVSVH